MVEFAVTPLYVPLYQILLLLLVTTLALLFGKMHLALMVNYLFTLYWGYILNREVLVGEGFSTANVFTAIYFVLGLVVVVLALIGFLASRQH